MGGEGGNDDSQQQRYKPHLNGNLNSSTPFQFPPPTSSSSSTANSNSSTTTAGADSAVLASTSKQQQHQQYAQQMGSGSGSSASAHHNNSNSYAQHRAIKIIPDDLELSSGMHRSRSSSIQLHLPPIVSVSSPSGQMLSNGLSPSGSRSTSPSSLSSAAVPHHHQPNGSPSVSSTLNGSSNTSPEQSSQPPPQFNLHLLPRVNEDDENISPPLRSPSMLKPFRPNPQLVRRRGGTVYIYAIIGGAFTLFILFIVLLSGNGSAGGLSNAQLRTANLKRYSSSSSASFSRLSSYLGSYLPFMDQYYNSPAMVSLTSSAYLFGHTAEGTHTLHPILPLLTNARQRAESLFRRQSSTLTQAVAEYRRRYKKDPPKGFDKWWSFAKARNHSLVDEYDSLMADISQYATLPAHILKQRTRTLSQLPGVSLITISNGKSQIHSKSGKWAPALALQEMMNAFVGTLPDMEIAINEKPEGRVLPGRWKEVKLDEWDDEEFPVDNQQSESHFALRLVIRLSLEHT